MNADIVAWQSRIYLIILLFMPLISTAGTPPCGASAPLKFGKVTVVSGDICKLHSQWNIQAEAITNAAQGNLGRGGGLCNAVYRAAGEGLADACKALGGCKVGKAKTTDAFDLQSNEGVRKIIHAVGPSCAKGSMPYSTDIRLAEKALRDTYQSVLSQAHQLKLGSIALPGISVGIFQFPERLGMEIAAQTLWDFQQKHPDAPEGIFVLFHDGTSSMFTVQGNRLRAIMENELSVLSAPGIYRAKGRRQVYSTEAIKIDTSKKYRIRIRVRLMDDEGDDKGAVCAGVACLDQNYNRIGLSNYCVCQSLRVEIADGWQIIDGYIQGVGGQATQFKKGTVYIRPMCHVNYCKANLSKVTGITEVSALEVFDENGELLNENAYFKKGTRFWSHKGDGMTVPENVCSI